MGGLPERERVGRERGTRDGSKSQRGWRDVGKEVVAEGRVERQKEDGKAGQRKGQDKQCGTNGNESRLDTVKRKKGKLRKEGQSIDDDKENKEYRFKNKEP